MEGQFMNCPYADPRENRVGQRWIDGQWISTIPAVAVIETATKQMVSGAQITAWSTSGGSAAIKEATVDCGATGVWAAEFTITDAAVTAASKIMAEVTALATADNDADEIEMSGVMAVSGTISNGSFLLFLLAGDGPISGQFKINYLVG